MNSFSDLGLSEHLLQSLRVSGYISPTPIQELTIPNLIQGRDLLGIAQTGTGKTAAFLLPILERLVRAPLKRERGKPRVLILAPTRELCIQICEKFNVYRGSLNLQGLAIFGGVGQKDQVAALREGIDVLVATPGRLLDLLSQKQVQLLRVEMFIMDEADRMMDMGFSEELTEVVRHLPESRQTVLFSATMPKPMERLSRDLLHDPLRVEADPRSSLTQKIEQKIIFCKRDHKFQLLKKILKEEIPELALVFTRTRENADSVVEYLAQNRIPSRAIHGEKEQVQREKTLQLFKDKAMKVLVATDIASRGIDIDDVTLVINFDLPLEAESYVHRIGRTARAGKSGKAISFSEDSEMPRIKKILELIGGEIPTETYEGKFEPLRIKSALARKVTRPTPGKSQERTAYLDHSKRQRTLEEGEKKKKHPGFKKTKKRRK